MKKPRKVYIVVAYFGGEKGYGPPIDTFEHRPDASALAAKLNPPGSNYHVVISAYVTPRQTKKLLAAEAARKLRRQTRWENKQRREKEARKAARKAARARRAR